MKNVVFPAWSRFTVKLICCGNRVKILYNWFCNHHSTDGRKYSVFPALTILSENFEAKSLLTPWKLGLIK